MISMTSADVEAARADQSAPRTATCPLCDVAVKVQSGVSLPHLCACGNVWQPAQVFSRAHTCIVSDSDGAADRIMAGFIAPLGPMPARRA